MIYLERAVIHPITAMIKLSKAVSPEIFNDIVETALSSNTKNPYRYVMNKLDKYDENAYNDHNDVPKNEVIPYEEMSNTQKRKYQKYRQGGQRSIVLTVIGLIFVLSAVYFAFKQVFSVHR